MLIGYSKGQKQRERSHEAQWPGEEGTQGVCSERTLKFHFKLLLLLSVLKDRINKVLYENCDIKIQLNFVFYSLQRNTNNNLTRSYPTVTVKAG